MKRCPVCAELLADDLSICPFCGEPLNATPPPYNGAKPQDTRFDDVKSQDPRSGTNSPDRVKCPICGELIAPGLAVCPICGESLAPAPAKPPVPPVTPAPAQPEPPAATPPEPPAPVQLEPSPREDSTEMKPCPVCGEMVSAHQDTCPYCFEPTGFGVLASATSNAAAATPPPIPPKPTSQNTVVPPVPEPAPEPAVESATRYTAEPAVEPTRQDSPGRTQYVPEPESARPTFDDSASSRQDRYGNIPGYSNNEPPVPPVVPPPVASTRKGGGMKWLIAALLALLALAIGVALYLFLSKDKSDDDKDKIENAEVKPNATVEQEESDSAAYMDVENSLVEEDGEDEDIDATTPVQQVEKTAPAPVPAPAPPSRVGRPDPNYDGAYDDVGSPRDRHRHGQGYDRPHRGVDADEWQDRHHRNGPPPRSRDRNNEEVAPPQSSGTGFHFERQDGKNPQRGNSGNNSGFQLQEVDRIPNQ